MRKISSRGRTDEMVKLATLKKFFADIIGEAVDPKSIKILFERLVSADPEKAIKELSLLDATSKKKVVDAFDKNYPGGFARAEELLNGAKITPITPVMDDMVEVFSNGNATEISALIKRLKETNRINELDTVDVKKIRDSINSNSNIVPDINGGLKGDIRNLDAAKWDAAKALVGKPVSPSVSPAAGLASEITSPNPVAAVAPGAAKSSIRQKISEIFGKAKGYAGNLSPATRSRALKGILVGAGLIGTSGLTYAAWSNLSAGDGADALTQQTIRIKEIIMPIFDNDVSPNTIGGDLTTDISEADKNRFVRNITDAVLSGQTNQLSPEAITTALVNLPSARGDGLFGRNITYNSIMKADEDWVLGDGGTAKSSVIDASEQLISIANEIESNAAAVEAAEDSASKASATEPGTSPTTTPPISTRPDSTPSTGGSAPSATSDSGYESSSLIMKEKGYLKSVQSSWTQEFDTAFRSFVDAGTAAGKVPTKLTGGQEWSDVAGSLGFPPNKSGAFSAIIYLADFVGKKTSAPTTGVTTPAPSEAPAATTPVAAEDNPVLAAIIGAMYNQKLVGTPGFDLIREPKRIRALIESAPVGGPNPTGYGNAARIVMKMNPAIGSMLPAQLTGPVDEVFAKNPANKSLLQAIQVAINGIYESAIPALVKPGLERSRELISRYLGSPAGGNWTVKPASNSVDQWVKLASERKMRIRAEIAAEMTPAEMAAARRIKMRET